MCGLCAALGAQKYWTDAARRSEFSRNGQQVSQREERRKRLRIATVLLDHFDVDISDWGGSAFFLKGRKTGYSDRVYQIHEIWDVAEHVGGRECDPLDPELLIHLEALMEQAVER